MMSNSHSTDFLFIESDSLSLSSAPSVTPAATSNSQTSISKITCDVCPSCRISLTGWNNMRRSLHINACKSRKPPECSVNMCTVCHRMFTTKQGLTLHKKKCGLLAVPSTSTNLSNRQSTSSNASDGDFQPRSTSARSGTSARKKWEGDEDMQTAVALSRSIQDEAKRLESQIKLESKELPLPASLTLTAAQKNDIVVSRVAAILSDGSGLVNSVTDTFQNGTIPNLNVESNETESHNLKSNSSKLWKNCSSCFDETDCYYVSALVPPLSPCKISVQEKLITLTQVPGRDKSRWSQANRLLTPFIENEPLAQEESLVEDSTLILSQGFIPPAPVSESHSFLVNSFRKTEMSTINVDDEKSPEIMSQLHDVCSLAEWEGMIEHQKKFFQMINNPQLSDIMIECKDHVFLHAHKFILIVNASSINLENVQSLDLTEYHHLVVKRVLVGLYTGISLKWSQEEETVWNRLGILPPVTHEDVHICERNSIECDILPELGNSSSSEQHSVDIHEMDFKNTSKATTRHSIDNIVNLSSDKSSTEKGNISSNIVDPVSSILIENSSTSHTIPADIPSYQEVANNVSCDLFSSSQPLTFSDSPVRSWPSFCDGDIIDDNNKMTTEAALDEPFTPVPLSKRLKLSNPFAFDSPSTANVNNSRDNEIFSQPSAKSDNPLSKSDGKTGMWSPVDGILAVSTPPSSVVISSNKNSPLARVVPISEQITITPPPIQNKTFMKKIYSPLTPMPLYESMMTPHLKKSLAQFGVRPLGKKKAIILLKEIYRFTHQDKLAALTNQVHATTTASHKNESVPSCEVEVDNTGSESDVEDDAERDFYTCDGALEESMILMESENIEPHEVMTNASQVKQSLDASKKNEPAEQQVLQFIRTNPSIYLNVLLYEPLELDYLHAEIKAAGIKIGLQRLMNVLDEQCITFTMRNRNQPGHNRHQRSKKRKAPQGFSSQASAID